MKRASFLAALVFCFAAIVYWNVPNLLLPGILISGSLVGISVIIFLFYRKRWLRDLLFSLCCFLISTLFLWTPVSESYRTAEVYDGKTLCITVQLTEDPSMVSTGIYRYVGTPVDGPFSQKITFFSSTYYTDAGGTVTSEFVLHRPKDDSWMDYFADGVVLRGNIQDPQHVSFSDPEPSFYTASTAVRKYTFRSLYRFVGGDDAGFMNSVLTGNKDSLSATDYQVLCHTGMLHIVAVSGLHVSVFVAFVSFFLNKLRSLRLRVILGVLALGVILLFSGFTPSVCRAVIMNLIVFGGTWVSAPTDAYNRLGIAAIVILLVAPYAVLSLSFQLSFLASLGIILFSAPFTDTIIHHLFVRRHIICGKVLRNGISLFCVSVSAFILTLPLLWLFLDSYSVWSLFLSPVILPVLQLCFFGVLTLMMLAWIPFLSFVCRFLGLLIGYGVKFMRYLSFFAVSIMDMVETIPTAFLWIFSAALLILAVLVFFLPVSKTSSKRKKKLLIRRGLSLVIVAISLLTVYQASESVSSDVTQGTVAPAEGVLQTAFLDVGQGNCSVTILDGEAYVVDCGGTKKAGLVASDYLTKSEIEQVEFVLISHLHDDHANGLEDLCAEKEIEEIIIPYTEGDAALYSRITMLAAEEGATLTVLEEDTVRSLGGSTLRLLTKHLDPSSDDQNENSIVGLCEYGNYRALFTGDITSRAEKRLVSAYGEGLNCDILSVPHHGSKSSSSKNFIKATSPVYAVISVGADNNYGHPTQEALDRILDSGASVLRTDRNACISVRSDGENMEVTSSNES